MVKYKPVGVECDLCIAEHGKSRLFRNLQLHLFRYHAQPPMSWFQRVDYVRWYRTVARDDVNTRRRLRARNERE